MTAWIMEPWPWYVAGPLIGLMVPLLLVLTGKAFGVSSSLRHICAATYPRNFLYFQYDWKRRGLWNLLFVLGITLGGVIAGLWLGGGENVVLAEATAADLADFGLVPSGGLAPPELFSLSALGTLPGFIVLVLGGFLVGFGARYAGGCTSGHAIMGLATFQKPSLIAVVGFFIGGLVVTHLIYPLLF